MREVLSVSRIVLRTEGDFHAIKATTTISFFNGAGELIAETEASVFYLQIKNGDAMPMPDVYNDAAARLFVEAKAREAEEAERSIRRNSGP